MERIIKFLLANGYNEETEKKAEYRSFFKQGLYPIDVNEQEIVLIDEKGDFLHLPKNYYALIGALLHYRQIAMNYIT